MTTPHKDFRQHFPRGSDLDFASPEQIGSAIIDHIHSRARQNRQYKFNVHNFPGELLGGTLGYSREEVDHALPFVAEGIEWATQHYLLISAPSGQGWMNLTRWSRGFHPETDLPLIRLRRMLPDSLLHPKVREAALDIFNTGRFEAAVFEAFKLVEIAVREAAGYAESDYGTDMIAKAFHADTGPLSDQRQMSPERQAMMRLMTGAHGVFKNPRSHRDLDLTDPIEAAEMLVVASHLLRIVDACSARAGR